MLYGLSRNYAPGMSQLMTLYDVGGALPTLGLMGLSIKGFCSSEAVACESSPLAAPCYSWGPCTILLEVSASALWVSAFQAPDPRTWSSSSMLKVLFSGSRHPGASSDSLRLGIQSSCDASPHH